jgi:putative glycosyltransferase (TIGR04372 family)
MLFIDGLVTYRVWRMPSAIDELNIRLSGIGINSIRNNQQDYTKMWHLTDVEQVKGEYHSAVTRRIEIMESLYSKCGYLNDEYFPPILGTSWVSNFGHLGVLGTHVLAEKLSLIPNGVRTIVTGFDFPNKQMLEIVSGKYNLINHANGNRWTEMSAFWPLSERLQTIRLSDRFVSADEFIDMTFKNLALAGNKDMYMSLPSEYIENSRQKLFEFGLDESSKFVALHLRESGKKGDPRTQPVASYAPAINALLKRGIWVIKIGDSSNSVLIDHPKYIDLTKLDYKTNSLHPFILAKCMFFIATASGPSQVARLFGTPTLFTNMSEVGYCVTCAPAGSIYLPRTWSNYSGQKLSLTELFQSKLAFAPSNPNILKSKSIKCTPNTSDEIFEATMEILNFIESKSASLSRYVAQVDSIREYFKAPGTGNFSNTYLEKNNSWFCK